MVVGGGAPAALKSWVPEVAEILGSFSSKICARWPPSVDQAQAPRVLRPVCPACATSVPLPGLFEGSSLTRVLVKGLRPVDTTERAGPFVSVGCPSDCQALVALWMITCR